MGSNFSFLSKSTAASRKSSLFDTPLRAATMPRFLSTVSGITIVVLTTAPFPFALPLVDDMMEASFVGWNLFVCYVILFASIAGEIKKPPDRPDAAGGGEVHSFRHKAKKMAKRKCHAVLSAIGFVGGETRYPNAPSGVDGKGLIDNYFPISGAYMTDMVAWREMRSLHSLSSPLTSPSASDSRLSTDIGKG